MYGLSVELSNLYVLISYHHLYYVHIQILVFLMNHDECLRKVISFLPFYAHHQTHFECNQSTNAGALLSKTECA